MGTENGGAEARKNVHYSRILVCQLLIAEQQLILLILKLLILLLHGHEVLRELLLLEEAKVDETG